MKKIIPQKINKKGTEMWWIIVMGIIALIAVIVIVIFFNDSVGKSKDIVKDKFDGFGDSDCDKVADFTDVCPKDKNIQTKDQLGTGTCGPATPCPASTT